MTESEFWLLVTFTSKKANEFSYSCSKVNAMDGAMLYRLCYDRLHRFFDDAKRFSQHV